MDFSYYDKNKNIKTFSLNESTSWRSIKVDDDVLNSIFSKVDVNKDGIIQQKEINLLNNLFQIAKNRLKGNNGNDTLENQEIVELNQALENSNKTNIIDTNETTQPENYQYIDIYDFEDE